MKTQIIISGQISGNYTICRALSGTGLLERRNGMFNSIILTYETKQAAVTSLSAGYQSLCREMPDEKGKMSGIRYLRGCSLAYDASRAVIQ